MRVNLVLAELLGIAIARHLVQLPPLAALPLDELVATVAPDIDALLATPPAPAPGGTASQLS